MLHRDITMIHKSSPCQVPPMVNGDRLSIVDHRPDIQSRLKSSRKPCPLKNDVRHPKPEREVNIILTFLMQIRDDLNFRILCAIGPRSGYIDIVIFAIIIPFLYHISSSTFFKTNLNHIVFLCEILFCICSHLKIYVKVPFCNVLFYHWICISQC